MKRIHKVDTRSQATAYGWSAVLLALPFIGAGAFFALGGFGVTRLPGKANAPLPVIGFVGLAFFLAGSTLLVHGLRGLANKRRIADRRNRNRVEPWFLDFPWDPRGARDNAMRRALSGVLGIALFAVFLVPFNWWAFLSEEGNGFVVAIVVVFDLVLLLIVGSTAYRTAQLLMFGYSYLRFRRFPYHPGESLLVGFSSKAVPEFSATLRFIEERFETSGTGRHRSTRLVSYEHFGERKEFALPEGMPEVEIAFEIPENPEWVTELSGQPVRYWELLVESERPGLDFRTTFALPVYPRY